VRIFSVGHGTREFDAFVELLASAGVTQIADVRSFPGSRRNPQFGKDVFADALGGAGVAYHWLPALGGRRKKPLEGPSPNPAWRVDAFRNYADYMDTDAFAAGVASLISLAAQAPTAYLCAETHWSKCHRRLLSDKLWSLGHEVIHLITPARHEPHVPTPFLRVDGDRLRYDRGVDLTVD
jgi:uncharacterized protein (DUF488 family)